MNNKPLRKDLGGFLMRNNVTLLFVVLCVGAFLASGTSLTYLLPELFTRIGRNTFMVLSLLIPVVAGLGLNFGIVIGAIAAQISIFLVVLWGFEGLTGLLLCVVICTPLAILFGYLVGRLFNSMKGTEMIGGLVAGYFSDFLYQFLFLFVLGGIIKINNNTLMISTGVGVKNAINLTGNLKYSLDNLPMISILDAFFWISLVGSIVIVLYRLIKKQDLKLAKILRVFIPVAALYGLSYIPAVYSFLSKPRLRLLNAVELAAMAVVLYSIYKIVRSRAKGPSARKHILWILAAVIVYALTYVPEIYAALIIVQLPVMTYLCIAALCLVIPWFLNTKMGQDMRTVGQNRAVATSAGIDVNRARIIAMIISTVLASYGQLISLQNIGTVATYGSHQQVGLYAIAALLVGGASVHKATTKQAILGIVLFHTLFILAPLAGKALLGNAQIGEYFRVFVAYGVIALALAMHAWSSAQSSKKKPELGDGDMADSKSPPLMDKVK